MTDVTVDLIVPLDPVLRALHRRQLSYRARVARPVLLGNELGEPPPDIHLLGAFGEAPVLAIGNRIVPPADFTVDNEAIQWDTGSGPHRTTGMLRFGNRGVTAAGLVTTATSQLSVQMDLQPVFFDCLLSADAGAHVAVGGDGSIQLHTDGVSWDSATWVGAGLRYGYTVTADGGIGLPPVVVSQFVDTGTGVSWQPDGFGTNVSEDGVLTFDAQGELPDPDDRSKLAPAQAAFKIVLPTRMVAEFADDGDSFVGAMVVDENATPPLVYTLRGTYVDDISSHLVAPEVWDDAVAATGAATVTLSDTELANFRPFVQVQTPTGNRWSEVVRPQAVADFDAILKMNVPDDLAQFVGSVDPVTKRPILPKLDDEVLRIAQLPGVGGEAGPTWYSGLGVPYLVGSLSNVTDDPGAAMLNAKRSRMWMRTIMPSAPVYKVQMPALYAYRYGKNNPQGKNPAIQGYLDDQALTSPNHVAHVAEVTADAVAWKQQMTAGMPNVKPEDIKAFTDIVDELSALGEQGCYWAYRLFRFATSPAALSEVHGLSLSPAQDSSLLAVRVQSTCATLSVLDPSGTFTKEYVKVISLVQLTNVLPQLLNYAGYVDGVRAMVPQLVEAFIAEHLDSTDPDIQEAVKQLQDAVDRNQVLDLVNDILGVGAALSGAYQWSRLLSKLGKYPGGIGVIAGSVITAAVAAAGLAMFVYGCLNWNSLSTEARANLVVGAIQIVFDMAMSIIKFGGKLAGIWSPEVGRWERMIALINPFRTEADAVQERIQGRTMRRILDRANQGDYADAGEWEEMQIFRAERDAEVGDEPDAALDEFGLNLEPFELGVGFVFALFNLIMSAIAVSESTDPLDKAQNGLFLASSILDGVAYAVGFASTFVEVAAETAALIASIVSACTIFASILAAIGLAITIAVMSAPHDTPIETFAKGDAKVIGFDMPLGYAIESFEAYAPQQGPSFAAVTVSGPGSGANVLHVAADGTLAYAAPDQTSATCWYLTVDGNGRARLSSANPVTNKVVCLAVTPSGQLATAAIDTSESTGTPQLWIASLLQAPTTSGSDPVAGVFQLTSVATPTLHLDLSGPQPGVSATATAAVVLTMATMKPQGLTMTNMVLSTDDRDRVFAPTLVVPGSSPATWTLAPPPLPWFTMEPTTGVLTQVEGVAPPVTQPTTFTLTCDNQVATAQTTFTIQVKVPATVEV